MVKGIIFDLDGTLLDTSRDICKVLNDSLKKFSLPTLTLELTLTYVGNGAKKLVERAVGKRIDLFDEVYTDYLVNFSNCDNALTRLYEGEAETLTNLGKKGVRFAIVSNKPQGATDRVYSKFLSSFGFCEVLGQTEYYALKPDPASSLAALKGLNVKKEECIYVGDGETDVLTAKNCGLKCVSVLWGFRTREQLEKAGATCFAENFYELERIIDFS